MGIKNNGTKDNGKIATKNLKDTNGDLFEDLKTTIFEGGASHSKERSYENIAVPTQQDLSQPQQEQEDNELLSDEQTNSGFLYEDDIAASDAMQDEEEEDDNEEDSLPTVSLIELFAPYMPLKIRQENKLNKYRTYLLKKNKRQNLTAITKEYDIAVKHFLDSALGAQFVPQNALVCDIGSGAGFPAVVLKILRKDIQLTMVDSVGKKVEFLRRLCKKLDIEAERFNTRAEMLSLTRREYFDCVTARAVAPLSTLLEYCIPLVAVGGIFLAYKGADAEQEAESAQNAAKLLGAKLQDKQFFVLPNGDKRCILIYKKISTTNKRYPRGQNLPKKKPL